MAPLHSYTLLYLILDKWESATSVAKTHSKLVRVVQIFIAQNIVNYWIGHHTKKIVFPCRKCRINRKI